jgi:hypothetical protein
VLRIVREIEGVVEKAASVVSCDFESSEIGLENAATQIS